MFLNFDLRKPYDEDFDSELALNFGLQMMRFEIIHKFLEASVLRYVINLHT